MEAIVPPSDNTETKQSPRRQRSRKRSIMIFVTVSLLNVALLIFLWTQLLTPAPQQATAKDPLVGKLARNFTLAQLNTHSSAAISLANFRGKPVVLNVWNSTCVPCIQEAPLLQTAWQHVQAKGIVFLGVDFQDTRSDGLNYLQKNRITYPNVLDASGSVAIDYGVTGTPETIFIDSRGVVVNRVAYELTAQLLQSNLNLLSH